MRSDKPPLPTRDEVKAINGLATLEQLLADVIEDRIAIEDQLAHSSRDEEWEKRAIGALTAHRICEHNIRHQIAKVSGRTGANQRADETLRLAKAERATADAIAAQAAAQRKRTEAYVVRTSVLAGIHKAIKATDYLAAFHASAHALLDEETCRRLNTEAQRRQAEGAAKVIAAIEAQDRQAEPAE